MLILDHFLPLDVLRSMRASMQHDSFPWEKSRVLSPSHSRHLDEAQNLQFVHGFFRRNRQGEVKQSRWLPLVQPVLRPLAPAELVKVKVNLTLPMREHLEYGLHVDTTYPGAMTAILYLNTNDGYTVFEDGQKVQSVENRLILFPATRRHTGASCTGDVPRLVLNMNFVPTSGHTPGCT